MTEKVVLAFSGGLGTMASLELLKRRFGPNVITFTANLGQKSSTANLCRRAIELGACSAHIADLRERFARDYIYPSLRAGALFDSGYALAHALARPLIVSELVTIAREEGASYIAHGCGGKSNDQVRFEVSAAALAPDLRVLSPLREHNLLRMDEVVNFCREQGLPSTINNDVRFSITQNLYGSSVQWDRAPDAYADVPEGVYRMTRPVREAPDTPQEVTITFQGGLPVALDGVDKDPVALVDELTTLAGEHGVGRLTTIEDRLIGFKMLEVYEQPAATVLHAARRGLERMVLPQATLEWLIEPARRYARLTYEGFWFSELREALDAFFTKSSEYVCGDVRMQLYKGQCQVVGVRSEYSLYSQALAAPTTEGDSFAHSGLRGFMDTLRQSVQHRTQDY
ncbi:MAG: argininosuccinate synthase [Planctomycetota bacterium]